MRVTQIRQRLGSLLAGALAGFGTAWAYAQGVVSPPYDSFVYRGVLERDGMPVRGDVDLHFRFFDAASNGTELVGGEVVVADVAVTDGHFTASVPLPAAVTDAPSAWMSIAVDDGGGLRELAGRQRLTSVPYATRTAEAVQARNALHADAADTADEAKHAATADIAVKTAQVFECGEWSASATYKLDYVTNTNAGSAVASIPPPAAGDPPYQRTSGSCTCGPGDPGQLTVTTAEGSASWRCTCTEGSVPTNCGGIICEHTSASVSAKVFGCRLR